LITSLQLRLLSPGCDLKSVDAAVEKSGDGFNPNCELEYDPDRQAERCWQSACCLLAAFDRLAH
jgi:hypothetical protein